MFRTRCQNAEGVKPGRQIIVKSLAYDGSERKRWPAIFAGRNGNLIKLVGEFDRNVEHPDLGFIRRGTISHEYFWHDRWYNVFRFNEPDRSLRNYYFNISKPPVFEADEVRYVDLDIDVLVWPDESFQVLDVEEFEANAAKVNYSQVVIDKVWKTVDEVTAMIRTGPIPFSFEQYS